MSCFWSFMPTLDLPETQGLIQGLRKVGKYRGRGNNSHSVKRRQRGLKEERGETAEAVPQAVKRQLAQRCACPIFSFPHVLLRLKQLLEHLYTNRLQHRHSCRQLPHTTGKLNLYTSSGVSALIGSKVKSRPSALLPSGCVFS